MHKITEYETGILLTGLYERFDPPRFAAANDYLGRLLDRIDKAIRHWHKEYAIARTMAVLVKLDSHILHDIGIKRDEIPAAARHAVEKSDAV